MTVLVHVQDQWRLLSPRHIDAANASQGDFGDIAATASRLQERPELVAWLTYVRDLQLARIAVHGNRLERARGALQALERYGRIIQESRGQ